MKKMMLLVVSSAILLFACQNTSQNGGSSDSSSQAGAGDAAQGGSGGSDSSSASQPESNVPDTANRCYLYTQNRDTVQLQVTRIGTEITGNLNFNLYEKDKNTGVINGTTIGDTVIVFYTFNAEGQVSTRQEIFIRQGSGYVLATGERIMKDNRLVFVDRKKIKAGTINLAKVDCNQ